jgi:hypothetical protein
MDNIINYASWVLGISFLVVASFIGTVVVAALIWPISLPLFLFTCIGFLKDTFLGRDSPKFFLVPFSSFLVTLSILAWGSVFMCYDIEGHLSRWPYIIMWILLLFNLPVGGVSIICARGARLFAFSLVLLQVWLSMVAAFISLFLVTCDVARL